MNSSVIYIVTNKHANRTRVRERERKTEKEKNNWHFSDFILQLLVCVYTNPPLIAKWQYLMCFIFDKAISSEYIRWKLGVALKYSRFIHTKTISRQSVQIHSCAYRIPSVNQRTLFEHIQLQRVRCCHSNGNHNFNAQYWGISRNFVLLCNDRIHFHTAK